MSTTNLTSTTTKNATSYQHSARSIPDCSYMSVDVQASSHQLLCSLNVAPSPYHDAPIRLRSSSPITQRTDTELLNEVVEIDQVVETGGTWV